MLSLIGCFEVGNGRFQQNIKGVGFWLIVEMRKDHILGFPIRYGQAGNISALQLLHHLQLPLNIRKPSRLLKLLLSLDVLHLIDDPGQKLDAALLAVAILEDQRPGHSNHVPPSDREEDAVQDDLNEMEGLRVDGERVEGEERLEHACQHGDQFFPEVEVVAIDDPQDVVPLLGVAGVHQVRQDAHAVNAQILSKQPNVVIDVAVHTRPHILENTLVDLEDSFVALLRDDGVGALIQPLGEEDLISDVG